MIELSRRRTSLALGLSLIVAFGAIMERSARGQAPVPDDADQPDPSPAAPANRPNDVSMEFVRIQPGAFTMGCSDGDDLCFEDERPAHRVHITKAFEIGKYEVTQAQWQSVMGSNPSHFKRPDRPVEQVNWNDAQQFLQKLNAKEDGYRYRLPTEAEWERAARGGTTGPFAGSLDEMAWYVTNSNEGTYPVGRKQPNPWGLYDMHGNVWEWVQDWHDNYAGSPEIDPMGPAAGETRVLRGGSWYDDARDTRVSYRYHEEPTDRYNSVGFRCVREAMP